MFAVVRLDIMSVVCVGVLVVGTAVVMLTVLLHDVVGGAWTVLLLRVMWLLPFIIYIPALFLL